jgi:hypothetical protein
MRRGSAALSDSTPTRRSETPAPPRSAQSEAPPDSSHSPTSSLGLSDNEDLPPSQSIERDLEEPSEEAPEHIDMLWVCQLDGKPSGLKVSGRTDTYSLYRDLIRLTDAMKKEVAPGRELQEEPYGSAWRFRLVVGTVEKHPDALLDLPPTEADFKRIIRGLQKKCTTRRDVARIEVILPFTSRLKPPPIVAPLVEVSSNSVGSESTEDGTQIGTPNVTQQRRKKRASDGANNGKKRVKKSRNTSTQLMRRENEETRAYDAAVGNPTPLIQGVHRCTIRSCVNEGRICVLLGDDLPSVDKYAPGHWGLDGNGLRLWCTLIKENGETHERVPDAVKRACLRLYNAARTRQEKQAQKQKAGVSMPTSASVVPGLPAGINLTFYNSSPAAGFPVASAAAVAAPRSSPTDFGDSTEADSMLQAYLAFLAQKFRRDEYLSFFAKLDEEGWDFEQLADMTDADYDAVGIKGGFKNRIRTSRKAFKAWHKSKTVQEAIEEDEEL